MTRRQAVGVCSGTAPGGARVSQLVGEASPQTKDIRLGVSTYSFHNFQRRLTISMMKQLKTPCVSVNEFHLPYAATPEEAERARSDFQKAGLTLVSAGVIGLEGKDSEVLRRYFDYAKLCGVPMIIGHPSRATVGALEKLIKAYDIRVAIHNHGPEDEEFPTPQSVLDAVFGYMRGVLAGLAG